MGWGLTARRLFISGFVIFHVTALSLWTLPDCAIKRAAIAPFSYYVLPTGLWQWWAIFAPDPVKDTLCLAVEIVDTKGLRHIYEFPRLQNMPLWQRTLHYRTPKFVANAGVPELSASRILIVRYAARQLGLPASAYPITASLYFQVRPTPPPGTGESDPMTQERTSLIERFEIQSPEEVGS